MRIYRRGSSEAEKGKINTTLLVVAIEEAEESFKEVRQEISEKVKDDYSEKVTVCKEVKALKDEQT